MSLPRLSDVDARPIQWIWEGVLARGMLTILQGDPGIGKGFVSMDIAARITHNLPMPCSPNTEHRIQNTERRNVLLCSTEDMRAFTERPRAEAAGADLDRIYYMDELLTFGRSQKQMLEATILVLEEMIKSKEILLVVIDPLLGFLQSLAPSDAQSVRRALMALCDLAERYGCAILAVLHLNKKATGSALYRAGGSIAFAAVARFVYCLGNAPLSHPSPPSLPNADCQLPTAPDLRILACVKNNVSEPPPSLAFEIVPHQVGAIQSARVNWLGPTDLTADDLVAPNSAPRKQTAIEKAEALLYEILWDGPVPEKDVNLAAQQRQISLITLRRAKSRLKVQSLWDPHAGFWSWILPCGNGPKTVKGCESPK